VDRGDARLLASDHWGQDDPIGIRGYRELVPSPAAAPALEQHQPYSAEHGSIEAELIARASHDHALYRDDNAEFYYKLEEATRDTAYADSIKPFQRAKNGRGAWLALTSQYAGEDKWEMEIKKMDNLLHTRKWKGQSNYLLERHTQQQRNAYASMTAFAQHVAYQLPNEHTRVGYLIDSIKNNNAGLQAALGAIRNGKGPTEMRSNFEDAVAHLLPMDPVAKRRSAGVKRGSADISDTTADIAGFGAKPRLHKTGVHLWYYKDDEYHKLNEDQQDELREWRKSANYSGKKTKTTGRPQKQARLDKGALASAVEKEVSKRLIISATEMPPPTMTASFSDDEARAYIMSLMKVTIPPPTVVGAATASTALMKRVTLQSILAKAKLPRGWSSPVTTPPATTFVLPTKRRHESQPDENRRETNSSKITICVNNNLFLTIAAAFSGLDSTEVSALEDIEISITEGSRTELDSHANMPVVGSQAYILSDTGHTCDVSAYTPDYEPMQIKIVDAAAQYDCPYTDEQYILVIRNALRVPSMQNNLIPPFMMREVGLHVKDTRKIQINDPSIEDHLIYFHDSKLRIPLSLWGVFSYLFPTSKSTATALNEIDDVYMLTPSRWNPHQDAFATNEESMPDWEGNLIEEKHRKRIILSDIEDDTAMAASVKIGSVETRLVDQAFERDLDDFERPKQPYLEIWRAADQVFSVLATIDPILNDETLWERLHERAELGKFQASIGSTHVANNDYLVFDDKTASTDPSTDDDDQWPEEIQEEEILDGLMEGALDGNVDLDEIMASAIQGRWHQGVKPEHLSKIWRIDIEIAKRMMDITSQTSIRTDNPKIAKNYGTNDHMLRYKRINDYFFMDTFFATKTAGKSSRGHSCCQLFLTDKGFVYVGPMRSKKEVFQAVKQFAKEIGAPDAIIADAAREQKSLELWKFCSKIGTTLRVLEEGTPWTNKAKLYIGLIKEAVRKDMKASDCPLVFWDYCVERRARINNLTAKNNFKLHGSNAHTMLTGTEGDISNLCQYGWYDWCYYREQKAKFPFNREVLGRVLGPAKGGGNKMAQWVLKANGNVVPHRTVCWLQVDEVHSPTKIKKREIVDELIERRWGTSISLPKVKDENEDDPNDPHPEDWDYYEDDDEAPRTVPDIEDIVDSKGKLLNQQLAYDRLINSEVQLQLGEELQTAKVVQRAIGPDETAVGEYDDNPVMNSIVYEVEFPDGQVKEYSANVIAENMLSQVDPDGFSTSLMDAIVDYLKDAVTAVEKADVFVVTRRGQKKWRKITCGWQLLIRWKDGAPQGHERVPPGGSSGIRDCSRDCWRTRLLLVGTLKTTKKRRDPISRQIPN
jgi:hypothetical protein